MGNVRTDLSVIAGIIFFPLILGGCISIPDSPAPRFYALEAGEEHADAVSPSILSDVIVGVGPVKIPGYQDRPQIVTQSKDMTLNFAQFDRWGEALGAGVARLIREGLTAKLAGAKVMAFPWSFSVPVKYQVTVEIVRLNSDLDREVNLVAQWMIIDARNTRTLLVTRSEFHQSLITKDYHGLVKALGMACTSLSGEIAKELVALESSSPVIPKYN